MEYVHSFLRQEGVAAGKRIRAKILGAAGFAAIGGTAWAISGQRRIGQTVPSITANAAIAVATFAVCQESVRAARHGRHDAWNSVAAGSMAGALLTRAAYGRGFHILGFVVWGPVCGALHLANSVLQPGAIMRSFLAGQDLLDLPQQQQQRQQDLVGQHQIQQQLTSATSEPGGEPITLQPRSAEDVTEAEMNRWAEEIKQRELAELKALWRQQEQRAKAAAAGLGVEQAEQQQQQQQDGNGGKRWWGLLG